MCDLLLDKDLKFANNVLFIIGNGFDLSHGIESKYENFREYLDDIGKYNLLNLVNSFFDTSGTLWSDFESTLGKYDTETILEECRPDESIDFDHYMQSTAAIEDSPISFLKPTLEELKTEFSNWVNSIPLNGIDPIFKKLSPSSWYLTFNYLETLEAIYHIPRDHVFHIHGSRIDHGDYIFGHCNLQENPYGYDEDLPHYEEEARANIVDIMNEYVKQYEYNINQCQLFHIDLQRIAKIVVVGHSLSMSDWPYFIEIKKHLSPEVPWHISYHSRDEASSIEKKCLNLKISNYELFQI